MLRLALIENLRRLALANVLAYEQRRMAEELVDGLLGDGSRSGTDVLLELAVLIKDSPEILTFGAVHLLRYLRGKGLKAVLTHQWLEEKLRESGFNPDELIRQEHQRHAANQISIGNTVTALKTVSTTNWRAWFEGVSKVDEVLKRDPAHVYALNDFMTRDRCRHRIERMSRRTGMAEVEIARQAMELAVEARGRSGSAGNSSEQEDLRYWHVGYYLIDEGLPLLEKRIHYEAGPLVRTVRFVRERAFKIYGCGIAALTLLMLGWLLLKALDHGAGAGVLALIALVCAVPLSHLASDVVQWIVCHLTTPTVLPKLDFENGVPPSCRTLVTVHAIYNDKEAVRKSVEGLEVRCLANDDENIFFALLADLRDSDREQQPGDKDLINYTEELIAELNQKYAQPGQKRFHVLFRRRIWNDKEKKFMGWERKRGKIMEINRMILGDFHTSFLPEMIDKGFLTSIRYVITLDSDSQLPGGSARKLIGAISHPLNRAVIDASRRVVVRGYGILQPRVGVSLGSAGASRFSRIFSGHAGLDPYTQTVSDVYQDLFREGSYLGKGIYDVHAFEAVMHNRVPENALLSHDLFEGLFARVALITDVELIDDFPPRFNVYARRHHRWVRGDWQILPWMFSRVPDAKRSLYPNPVSLLGRWKLIDNLRRSLLAPTAFLLLWLSWLVFPGQPLYWTMLFVLIVAFPVYANVANAIVMPPLGFIMSIYVKHLGRDLLKHSGQALLVLSFLPYQAWLMTDAIVRTLYRLFVSRCDLLEWETAYNAEKRLGNDILSFLRELLPAMALSTLMYVSVFIFNPSAEVVHTAVFCALVLLAGTGLVDQSAIADDQA
jgi:cyclic beta-1,2-glucan synthetase